jgi:putative nucleotidyltransferase with HDIG domain
VRRTDAVLHVDARSPLDARLELALAENVERVLAGASPPFPMPSSRGVQPARAHAADTAPIAREAVAAIQSSVLHLGPDDALVLSLVFRAGPWCEDRDGFRSLHTLIKTALAEARESARYRDSFRGLVNKLLEPGLKRFAPLRNHSFAVARMARAFALHLGLPPIEVEQVTVAAILHDVGMRELNYDELYKKPSLTDEERLLLREHTRVGAFLVADIPWPYDVAPLVRHHHERWDGQGYPDGLAGTSIPLGARMIHLCEAFDAMTSPSSYRAVISVPQALDILVSKGGTQFDPELAPAFKKVVEGLKSE